MDIASCVQPRNQPSPRKSVPPDVSTRTSVPSPSGAEAARRHAESVTELCAEADGHPLPGDVSGARSAPGNMLLRGGAVT